MSPVDAAASVKARLLAQAHSAGEEFERTLARYAAERLLYRLGASAARERCLLKGASLLSIWLSDPYRATRDVDVLASGDSSDEAVRALLEIMCDIACPEDGVRFDLSTLRLEAIRSEEDFSGKRARFVAFLGKARIAVQLDIGFGDAVTPGPQEVEYPTMLASVPAPRVRAYPREATVAEKFEAMVKLDTQNSRMKDFHDLWALADALEFDGATLQRAVVACFARREIPWTHETPRPLTPAFYLLPEIEERWERYLAAGAVLVPPPAQFAAIGERIIQFLGPVRESIVQDVQFERSWAAGGPWLTRSREASS